MSDLPNKPSELLKLAMKCLRECEDDPNYRVDMFELHSPGVGDGEPTTIDLAGAVAAKLLAVPPNEYWCASDFDENKYKFWALQCFEFGEVDYGLQDLEYDVQGMDFNPPDYAKDKSMWHERMNKLADDLAERGL